MTLLARARSFHNLALLLATVLAWPGNLSMLARDCPRSSGVGPAHVLRPVGACFDRSGRRTTFDQDEWSVLADNTEGSDGRDDFRYAPLAIPHRPTELPSLVPSPLRSRLPDLADRAASSPRSAPLRC